MWLGGSRWNCRGDECEASIYSKTYTEGSDPLGPTLWGQGERKLLWQFTVAIKSDHVVPQQQSAEVSLNG